ncbi:MAG TPA: alpha/beta fold hydrolase [Candidatus Polarisedimenticolaceae bacterium]|nr:alpha/beta fold hydrolase [Candidatus Polarisedimenticolaceae bacterium]
MQYSERTYPGNSTTDRSYLPGLPTAARLVVRLAATAAPAPIASAALGLFLTPPRRQVPERETRWTWGTVPDEFHAAGRRLHGWSIGRGPTVLLVHGWGGRGSQLGSFVEPLVERGFRVVGYDGPGHGRSAGRRSSLPELAEAVRTVGAASGPLVAVIAHSLGAAATTVALDGGLDVGRVAYLAAPARLRYFIETFCAALGLPQTVERRMVRRIERRFSIRLAALDGTAIAYRRALPPALLVHDRADRDVPFAQSRELAEAWPAASLIATGGLGHRGILRDRAIVDRVVAFVSGDGATGGR